MYNRPIGFSSFPTSPCIGKFITSIPDWHIYATGYYPSDLSFTNDLPLRLIGRAVVPVGVAKTVVQVQTS